MDYCSLSTITFQNKLGGGGGMGGAREFVQTDFREALPAVPGSVINGSISFP